MARPLVRLKPEMVEIFLPGFPVRTEITLDEARDLMKELQKLFGEATE